MSFQDFISMFSYRRWLYTEYDRLQNIKPPANPSRRYIDKLVTRLLRKNTADFAQRELSMMGPVVVPSLIAALEDPRYHRAQWDDDDAMSDAPFEITLGLLASHGKDEQVREQVVKIATPLTKMSSDEVRKIAGMHLASVGRAETIPILSTLMQDADGYVRSYVCMGIHSAVTEGYAEELFRRGAYDLLLSQSDKHWGDSMNESADTIIILDPTRAAVDLGSERWLNLSNPNVNLILEACNKAKLLLPEVRLRQLLDAALPLAVGKKCYPNNHVVSAALKALALRKTQGIGAVAESLLKHENEEVKIAAVESLAILAGISDAAAFVLDRENKKGYETLSREQRVVYCAFLFDAEVCNGGLMQFFGNSSGDHTVDTLDALFELGHEQSHQALQSAIKLVGPLAREQDRELRLTAFEGRWEELNPAFESLDAAYYETEADLRQAWTLYAIRNANHFST